MTIDELLHERSPLNTRIRNALTNAQIETLDQLRAIGEVGALRLPNLGLAAVNHIRDLFARHGVKWAYSEEAARAVYQRVADQRAARGQRMPANVFPPSSSPRVM